MPSAQPTEKGKAPGFALASLILGILSLLGGFALLVPPILAIIFGHIGKSKSEKTAGGAGSGMALAGLIMGYLSVVMIPIIGLLAAMAIPAFHKVRTVSQEKAIMNNMRQLSGAADQYFLETGTTIVNFESLVGEDHYVKVLKPVAGETYPREYTFGQSIVVKKSDGKELSYAP